MSSVEHTGTFEWTLGACHSLGTCGTSWAVQWRLGGCERRSVRQQRQRHWIDADSELAMRAPLAAAALVAAADDDDAVQGGCLLTWQQLVLALQVELELQLQLL